MLLVVVPVLYTGNNDLRHTAGKHHDAALAAASLSFTSVIASPPSPRYCKLDGRKEG
jgi:hypothetical protein